MLKIKSSLKFSNPFGAPSFACWEGLCRIIMLGLFLWLAVAAQAADRTVTKIADTNDGACNADCSLREAIAAAAAGDTIVFAPLFNSLQTITLSGSELLINKSLSIRGTDARILRINGNNTSRVFNVNGASGTVVSISNLEITNGNAGTGDGGGILLNSANALNLTDVTLRSNRAVNGGGIRTLSDSSLQILRSAVITNAVFANAQGNGGVGGGIYNSGTANISNSSVNGNQASSTAGGIRHFSSGGVLTLNNVTVSINTSGGFGAVASGGQTFLRNTIIAGNTLTNTLNAPDANGELISLGNNLIGNNETIQTGNFPAGTPNANGDYVGTPAAPVNPQLGGEPSNNGQTPVRQLLAGSVAINQGNNCVRFANCNSHNPPSPLTTDQRGGAFPRQLQNTVDIGAFEFGTVTVIGANDVALRQAIADAPAGGAINFNVPPNSPGCTGGICTIVLTSAGQLVINKSLTMIGTGARSLIIQPNTGVRSRIFSITGSGNVVDISGLTVRNGHPDFVDGDTSGGGGIVIRQGNTLTLREVAVRNNRATVGGGVYNFGILNAVNSTISGNRADSGEGGGINSQFQSRLNIINTTVSGNEATIDEGGGIVNSGGEMNLLNSTITDNRADDGPGGVLNYFGSVAHIRNTIIAGNFVSTIANDVSGAFVSHGGNLIGRPENSSSVSFPAGYPNANGDYVGTTSAPYDARLGPLQDNGGQTDTHALLANSPAINRGNNCVIDFSCSSNNPPFALTTDQRAAGFARKFGAFVDIGAFEARFIPRRAPFDFDGDGKTDVSIFRSVDGSWWYLRSSDSQFRVFSFGVSSDVLTPGDYTGDGKWDIAVFRPSTGTWYIQRSEDNSFFSFPFGASGDIPAPADFDGDGRTDAAVFRPSTGEWFILNSADGGTSIVTFGSGSDKPVAADYDGDGRADIAIFRPSDGSWWYLQSSNAQFKVYRFGVSSDKPVQGDYTGDGKADIAVFRPASGEWFIQRSEDNSFFSFPFGANGDTPAPGDYDGDGKTDAAVFRPSTGEWFVQRSSAGTLITTFGANGDRPVPNAFVP